VIVAFIFVLFFNKIFSKLIRKYIKNKIEEFVLVLSVYILDLSINRAGQLTYVYMYGNSVSTAPPLSPSLIIKLRREQRRLRKRIATLRRLSPNVRTCRILDPVSSVLGRSNDDNDNLRRVHVEFSQIFNEFTRTNRDQHQDEINQLHRQLYMGDELYANGLAVVARRLMPIKSFPVFF
jgi:hypothetical protein